MAYHPRPRGRSPAPAETGLALDSHPPSRRCAGSPGDHHLGRALPAGGPAHTNADFERMVDTSDEWIVERTGIRERRVAPAGTGCSVLASRAAQDALDRRGISADEVDLIIVATVTPDMFFPATACLVQDDIGASRAWGFDLSAACSGFVFAVSTACQHIASGAANRALVIGSDVMSTITNYEDRTTCILFGDAAGAVLLEPRRRRGPLPRLQQTTWTGPVGISSTCPPEEASARPPSRRSRPESTISTSRDARSSVSRCGSPRKPPRSCSARCSSRPTTCPSWSVIRPTRGSSMPSASGWGSTPTRWVKTVHKYGNTTAASIPTALRDAIDHGRLSPGDLLLFSSVGAGLTVGTALMRWGGERLAG